jgi:hypothetical protein
MSYSDTESALLSSAGGESAELGPVQKNVPKPVSVCSDALQVLHKSEMHNAIRRLRSELEGANFKIEFFTTTDTMHIEIVGVGGNTIYWNCSGDFLIFAIRHAGLWGAEVDQTFRRYDFGMVVLNTVLYELIQMHLPDGVNGWDRAKAAGFQIIGRLFNLNGELKYTKYPPPKILTILINEVSRKHDEEKLSSAQDAFMNSEHRKHMQDMALAVCMGTHSRLGARSGFGLLEPLFLMDALGDFLLWESQVHWDLFRQTNY